MSITKVDNIVDPQQVKTDPVDVVNFVPTNKIEFKVAIDNLVEGLPVEEISRLYQIIKKIVENIETKTNKELEIMTKNSLNKESKKEILSLLEALNNDYKDDNNNDVDDDKELLTDEDNNQDEHTFQQIAQKMGFTAAGARLIVNKTIEKAQVIAANLEEPELETVILKGVKDYIKRLTSSDELSQEEIRYLYDNPNVLRQTDNFRNFLYPYIRKYVKYKKQRGEV